MVIAGFAIPNWLLTVGVIGVAYALLSGPSSNSSANADAEDEAKRKEREAAEKEVESKLAALEPEVLGLIIKEAHSRYGRVMTEDAARDVLKQICEEYTVTLDQAHKVKILEKQIQIYKDEAARDEAIRKAKA